MEIAFNERKINGKSKGEAYLELVNAHAAGLVKREIETKDEPGSDPRVNIWYTAPGNPFKSREGQSKKDASLGNNQSTSHSRGGYGGRSRGNSNNGNRGGQWQNQPNGGSFGSPMLQGFGNMSLAAFSNQLNMNHDLMGTMMTAASMNMQNMMAGRGGSNMMIRAGWNGRGGMTQQNGFNNGRENKKRMRPG